VSVAIRDLTASDRPLLGRASLRLLRAAHPHGLTAARVREALSLRFAPEVLSRSLGLIVSEDDEAVFALATSVDSAVHDGSDGLLHAYDFGRARAGAALAHRLLGEFRQRSADRGWRFLRARIPHGDAWAVQLLERQGGWRLSAVHVQKALDAEPAAPPQVAVRIREARPDDAPFVVSLLAEGLWNGLCPEERAATSRASLQRAAREVFRTVVESQPAMLIAEDELGPVAHATADLAFWDQFSGATCAMLHDVFVLPRSAGRGVATALSNRIERIARERACPFLLGTVHGVHDDETHALVRRLCEAGWTPTVRMLHCALEGERLDPRSAND
jgi:GNAT superfamily N-acetyltransferase